MSSPRSSPRPPVARRPAGRRSGPRWGRILLVGSIGALLLGTLLFGIAYATTKVPTASSVATAQTSVFRYSDGSELGRRGAQNRMDVPLAKVPVPVRRAVLAAEDRGYYSEPGISPTGIARALFANIRGGGVSQGGSTITQQYAKNAYLSSERTLSRKLREVFIAIKLDRTRSKNEVLRDYLNTIYFGRGAYGIEVAAETYFGKPVDKLSVEEAAVLASSIRSPATLDPAGHADAARARWRYVLDGMVKKGWLEPARAEAAVYPRTLPPAAQEDRLGGSKGYLIMQVEAELAAKGFTEDRLLRGGLSVTTTLDKKAQAAAAAAVEGVLSGPVPADLRQGLVAIEPRTGRIKAEYAGRDYVASPFNSITQGMVQPGSSFKPYVLTAALEKGIGLKSIYNGDTPQTFRGQPVSNFESGPAGDFGPIDLIDATAHSVNTVYFPLGFDAGAKNVVDVAHKAGITTDIDYRAAGGSMFLGGFGQGVRPLDHADGFATFAARGVHAPPYLVEKVETPGRKSLYEAKVKTDQAMPQDVSDDATFAMQSVVQRGTATAAQLKGGRPAAGKTGTTTGNVSAWFCGFTPQLSAAVVLYRDNGAPLENIRGVREVTGGTLPARIWKAFMDAALAGQPVRQFPPPAYVGSARGAQPTLPPAPPPTSATPSLPPTPSGGTSPTPTPLTSVPPSTVPSIVPTGRPSPTPSLLPSASPSASAPATPAAGSG